MPLTEVQRYGAAMRSKYAMDFRFLHGTATVGKVYRLMQSEALEYMWQSQVKIKHYSAASFKQIITFKVTGYSLLTDVHEKILPSFSSCRIQACMRLTLPLKKSCISL